MISPREFKRRAEMLLTLRGRVGVGGAEADLMHAPAGHFPARPRQGFALGERFVVGVLEGITMQCAEHPRLGGYLFRAPFTFATYRERWVQGIGVDLHRDLPWLLLGLNPVNGEREFWLTLIGEPSWCLCGCPFHEHLTPGAECNGCDDCGTFRLRG